MKQFTLTLTLLAIGIGCGGCGGGGGGSDDNTFSGTWEVNLNKAIDNCNLDLDPVFSAQVIVNQVGAQVAATSGSLSLLGKTNDEDGFEVSGTDRRNGCNFGFAYVFKNASDGVANVGLGIIGDCGAGRCSVAYGGTGVQDSGRALRETEDQSTSLLLDAVTATQARGSSFATDEQLLSEAKNAVPR